MALGLTLVPLAMTALGFLGALGYLRKKSNLPLLPSRADSLPDHLLIMPLIGNLPAVLL
jgi:hypothetical protein